MCCGTARRLQGRLQRVFDRALGIGVVTAEIWRLRGPRIERHLEAIEFTAADILRLGLRRRTRDNLRRLNQILHAALEHRRLRACVAEQLLLETKRKIGGALRSQARVGNRRAEPRAVELEENREARPVGDAGV